MNEITSNWTKEEFKAYLLLYAAFADHVETEDEKAFILSRVDNVTYENIHKEFDADNDYRSIQKLLQAAKKYNYSINDIELLMEDIKALFMHDGIYTSYEHNLLTTLRMLFK